jgi:hypothetical protein
LFQTDFGAEADRNFDGWPDGWEREVSAKFPHYLKIGLMKPNVESGTTSPAHALRVDLDGGAAWVRSPEIAINPLFEYSLDVQVHTSKLERNAAYVSLSFYDNKQRLVEQNNSKAIQNSVGWQTLTLGPVLPSKKNIVKAVIGLHLEPLNKSSDLRGFAEYATVRLKRVPRITLNSSRQDRIYFQPEQPEIICQASGFHDPNARVIFEVFDQQNQLVAVNELPLRKQSVTEAIVPPATKSAVPQQQREESQTAYSGEVQWRPVLKEAGYYRVRVQMPGELGIVKRRELSLIVLKPLPVMTQGEFGWSLPDGEAPLNISDLADLAGGSGIHWLKLPVWKASTDKQRADQLVWFAERMSLKRVNLVGVLSDPPDQVRNAVSGGQTDLAAGVFSAPEQIWFPTLEPIISRLSARVQYWQLGQDHDHSFIGFQDGPQRVALVRKLFSRFGQHMHFSVGWDWMRDWTDELATWSTVTLSAQPVLTANELEMMLDKTKETKLRRWVNLEPLSAKHYDVDIRTADLVQRMIVAKAGQATGIFLSKLCDDDKGILNSDGSGGQLYIPWRTTCYQLSNANYAGSLPLAAGIKNALFSRSEDHVLAIWSAESQRVTLQLGKQVQVIDCWGRPVKVSLNSGLDDKGTIEVPIGPIPIFIQGVNGGLARFQMQVQFSNQRWPSLVRQAQNHSIQLHNPFEQSINVEVKIIWPDEWKLPIRSLPNTTISAYDTIQVPFDITLPTYAGTGKQQIKLLFKVKADWEYQFITTREIEIGLDDLFAEFTTSINSVGELEIEQRLTNRTKDTVSFKCYLLPPDRKRMTLLIQEQGQGINVKTFILPNGEELINQTVKVNLVEVGGERSLSYEIKINP